MVTGQPPPGPALAAAPTFVWSVKPPLEAAANFSHSEACVLAANFTGRKRLAAIGCAVITGVIVKVDGAGNFGALQPHCCIWMPPVELNATSTTAVNA